MTDVGRKTVRAALWAFVSSMGKRILTLVGITLLARVLAPKDFGLIALAMSYITLIDVLGDLGVGWALVYWPERREDATQATFVVDLIAGAFWCAVSLACAPAVAHFFREPGVTPVIRVLSIAVLVKWLGNTHDMLLKKDLKFRTRAIPEIALTGFKAVVALVLAYFGFGAWSLVWGHVAGTVAWTVLLWILVPWRPQRRRFPSGMASPMMRYGRDVLAVQLFGTLMFYVDAVAVGRFLGKTSLGLYEMASRIPDSTIMVLIWVAGQTLFPAFAKLHASGEDVKRAYVVATRCVSALTLPASLGLFFLARPIILVFFGPQWLGAAPVLSILALYVGFRAVDEVGNVLKATGRTRVLVWMQVTKAVILVPAVIYSARFSIVAVAGALTVVFGMATLITTVIAARVIGIPLRSVAGAYTRSTLSAAVMGVVLFFWLRASAPFADAVQLAGGLIIGGAVYITALRFIDPEIFDWIRSHVLTRKKTADSAA